MELIEPYKPEEFHDYYQARWEFLRKPLGHPKGSEIDDFENVSLHVMAVDNKKIVGVGRLTYYSTGEGQIRFMGVHEDHRSNNVGSQIVFYLEKEAVKMGLERIFLNARETAVKFYRNNGYKEVEKPFIGLSEIPHYRMEKSLI